MRPIVSLSRKRERSQPATPDELFDGVSGETFAGGIDAQEAAREIVQRQRIRVISNSERNCCSERMNCSSRQRRRRPSRAKPTIPTILPLTRAGTRRNRTGMLDRCCRGKYRRYRPHHRG
jgi:hypothetical protein